MLAKRGTCSVCWKEVELDQRHHMEGMIGVHRNPYLMCAGSGQPPKETPLSIPPPIESKGG